MWAPHQTPAPVEKIRKGQWSKQNTIETQKVLSELLILRDAMVAIGFTYRGIDVVDRAIRRFKQLDPGLV